MARRGPKPRPAARPTPSGGPLWDGFAPAGLSAAARAEFDRLRAALDHAGTLDRTDPALVVLAARLSALVAEALARIEAEGLIIEAPNGVLMKHPLLETVNGQTMRLRGLLSDFGLTAGSAKGGGAKTGDDANPWTGLLGLHTG